MKYKYYYTYKITCTQGSFKGKFYFGQHTTNILDDNYIASGRKIKCYIKKYPNGYIREILNFYDSQSELNKAEYDLIHPWLNHPDCLNLRDGGYKPTMGNETRQILSEITTEYMKDPEHRKQSGAKNIGRPAWNKGCTTPEETKRKQSERKQEYYKTHTSWNNGIPCKDETKSKIRKKLKDTKRSEESKKKQGQTIKGHECYIKGKHRVYDNEEHTKWHFA